jgi:hypothetical protein
MFFSRAGFVAAACVLAAALLLSAQGCGRASQTDGFHPSNKNGTGGSDAGSGSGSGGKAGTSTGSGTGGHSGESGYTGNGGEGAGGEVVAGAGAGASAVGGAGDDAGAGAEGGTGGDPGTGVYGPFDVGDDPNANCVQAGQICHRFITIQCAGEVHCCKDPGRTFQECYDYMFDGCINQLYIDKISLDPIVGFDPDFACTAFTEYEQKTEQCDPSVVDWGASLDGLRGMIKGTRGPGEGCAPGVTPPTKDGQAAALASCSDGANQACLPTAVAFWNCRPLSADGGNCMTDINCLPDLYCDNPDLSVTGARCKYRKQIGEPCAAANECLTLVCKQGQCRLDDQQGVFCLQN